MRRIALVLAASLLLGTVLVGCVENTIKVTAVPASESAKTGQPVSLQVEEYEEDRDFTGCEGGTKGSSSMQAGSGYEWDVSPADGARVENGVFIASTAGSYKVTPLSAKNGDRIDYRESAVIEVGGPTVDIEDFDVSEDESPEGDGEAGDGEEVSDGRAAGTAKVDPAQAVELFATRSDKAVNDGDPPNPTKVTFKQPTVVTRMMTYHWNDAAGAKPGSIGLKAASGKTYGPWKVTETGEGQAGVANAYWYVNPMIEVPAGSYTVVDSDPGTWSWNSDTKGMGVTFLWGVPVGQ